jgi:hypothetical protein
LATTSSSPSPRRPAARSSGRLAPPRQRFRLRRQCSGPIPWASVPLAQRL